MCKAIEEMRNETARKTSLETAKSLLLIGKLTCEEIAQATKLTVEEVKELDGKKRAIGDWLPAGILCSDYYIVCWQAFLL